ncbi:MAG TPA: hypothetical protein VJ456_15945, partial [Acidimicrobiia bacterium]|nr:hypothetical protein [Acidimicrobiia bacterium]
MTATPISPRPGRLVRLGVVLDPRNDPGRSALVATLCDRAGIDVVWACQPATWPGGGRGWPLPDVLAAAAPRLASADLGAIVGPGTPSSEIETAVAAAGRSVEVSVPGDDGTGLPLAVATDLAGVLEEARRGCGLRGLAVLLPTSVGRTTAEARARADADPLFARWHAAEAGVFGTLEQCQDTVIALAHAGVTDLRCVLPNAPDIQDVIAQLTAVATGHPEVLAPEAPRSKAP